MDNPENGKRTLSVNDAFGESWREELPLRGDDVLFLFILFIDELRFGGDGTLRSGPIGISPFSLMSWPLLGIWM
jgi:hypothetical protein